MLTVTTLLCAWRLILADIYPYKWTAGDVNFTCNLPNPGWIQAGTSCFFPFTTRNQTWEAANQMCRSYVFGHSYGTRLQNWLIARPLLERVPAGIYWTGIRSSNNKDKLEVGWDLTDTSVYNPLWATDEPQDVSTTDKCVALDLSSERSVGWRLLNCTEQLPVLCETFSCVEDEFRCHDNTRCIAKRAVRDSVMDCGDGSDEKSPNSLSAVSPQRIGIHSFLSDSSSCQNVALSSPAGTIASPNYPHGYPQGLFCQWNIRAEPGRIVVINVEDVSIMPYDSLTVEGDNVEDRLALMDGSRPFSYVSRSSLLRLRFVSGVGGRDRSERGFLLHYVVKGRDDVCRMGSDSITFESWKEKMDCGYIIQYPHKCSYIVLEVHLLTLGERADVNIFYNNATYNIRSAGLPEVLVIPSNVVRLQVRGSWISQRYTALSVKSRPLGAEALGLALNGSGVTLKWFPSLAQDCCDHALRITFQPTPKTMFEAHTLSLEGHLSDGDAITAIKDGRMFSMIAPSTFRIPNLLGGVQLLVTKRSSSFRLYAQFSADCPPIPLPPKVRVSASSGRELGAIVHYSCAEEAPNIKKHVTAECLVGGKWSADPPYCKDSKFVFCALPVIVGGFVSSVNSPCVGNAYCNGTILRYGCDFGKLPGMETIATCRSGVWSPTPSCTDAICPVPEVYHLNATLNDNTTSVGPLAHAAYSSPTWSVSTNPFRVCAMDHGGSSYKWFDYNFKFRAPICRSYPVRYGHFDKPFYQNGETAAVTCLEGYYCDSRPRCINGEWTSHNATCEETPPPANACRNGRIVRLNPGYICHCNSGYQMRTVLGIHTCEDINECLLGFDLCDPDGLCVNLIGSYTCKCQHGKDIYNGQTYVNSTYLIPHVSCIWKMCSIEQAGIKDYWIVVDKRPNYRHGDTARFLCLVSNDLYAEFEARCFIGWWDVDNDPCAQPCLKSELRRDLKSDRPRARLLEHVNVSCKDKSKYMVGSSEIVCGHEGRWLSEPICADLHCPNLIDLIRFPLTAWYSDMEDKARVGTSITFSCVDSALIGQRTIHCRRDGNFSAKWSNDLPICRPRDYTSRVLHEESIVSAHPHVWTHSRDWIRYNSSWVGLESSGLNSFLLSPSIRVRSDSLSVVVHIQHLQGTLTIKTHTARSPAIPPLGNFHEVATAVKPGTVEAALEDLSDYLTIAFIRTAGSVTIQSVKLLYAQCEAALLNGVHLNRSFSFLQPRPVPISCGGSPAMKTSVTAICHPVSGWIMQTPNPCCSHCDNPHNSTTTQCTHEDCANGYCYVDKRLRKRCICNPGFHEDHGKCVPASCNHTFCAKGGHGRCEEIDGTGKCHCDPVFSKSPFCDVENDKCPTCDPLHKCVMVIGHNSDAATHECICAVDDELGKCPWSPCHGISCGRHGECVPDPEAALGYYCKCDPGWVGQECSRNITCVSADGTYLCENGGTCFLDAKGQPVCNCSARFTGATCNEVVDLCKGVVCEHGGTCEPTEDGHTCYCPPGFTGSHCEEEIDQCAQQNLCQQGECKQEAGRLWCDCRSGWTGTFCETQLNLCQEINPCLHGKCRGELPEVRICDCGSDYRGGQCEKRISYCQLEPCFNNGTCVEHFADGYTCSCQQGYTGANCEEEIDYCADWPCENGGSCIVQDHRPVCHCLQGFTGEHCQTDISNPCDHLTCLHGGTCYVKESKAYCHCPADYTGLRCETELDLCADVDCKNGGTCYIEDHSAKCKCMTGYGGLRCEKELTKCDEFPIPLQCFNGGTCLVTNHTQYCECSIDFFGKQCEVFGRSCAVIACNGGICVNDTDLHGHCICPPERTGDFCETEKTESYNLYFNGRPSSQKIVSRDFPSTFLREFTLCGWVYYAPEFLVSPEAQLGTFVQLNTTTGTSILSIDNTGVKINRNFSIPVKLSVMAWHHVCVRSPCHSDTEHPTWSVFLDGIFAKNASYEALSGSHDIRCLTEVGGNVSSRFRGEISLVQLYSVYLSDLDIAKMAFQCRDWLAATHEDLHVRWTDFTTVQRNNPGVMALYPGLCDVSDCLPGRPTCNTTDKIPPAVRSCPRNIRKVSSKRLTRIDWNTENMFTDNIGVVSIKSNYRSGQSFTWGYYRVLYVASDAAGNSAKCSFTVIVSPSECQTREVDQQLQGEVSFNAVDGIDSLVSARIHCNDPFYPRSDPEFYICDVMGQWDRSIFLPINTTYSFPSCGSTKNPAQNINGTLAEHGNCSKILQNLNSSLLKDLRPYCTDPECKEELTIDSDCPPVATPRLKRNIDDEVHSFRFFVKINSTRALLKSTISGSLRDSFPNATLSVTDDVVCDRKFPLLTTMRGNASCANCPAGKYWNGDSCASCRADTYRSEDDPIRECIPCPQNQTTAEQTGQKDKTACHDLCDAGECYDQGTKSCNQCPRGTYQEKRGGVACMPCPSYTTTTITGAKNATDCSLKCEAGTELVADSANCVPCARGTYWSCSKDAAWVQDGELSWLCSAAASLKESVNKTFFTGCVECPQGLTTVSTRSTDVRYCEVVDCPAGTHVNLNRLDPINALQTTFDSLCVRCESGTYQDERNQTSCKPCTATSNCTLVNECSPLLANTCPDSSTCELQEFGIYSCSTVVVQPTKSSKNWIFYVVIPIIAALILATLALTAWICRQTIMLVLCCRNSKASKQLESTDYYRSSTRPRLRRTNVEYSHYRNYPPRSQNVVRPSEDLCVAALASRRFSLSSRPQIRQHNLPPPIITSRAELDLLKDNSRMRTTNVLPSSSRSLGSHIVTGYSSESPGPSVSAQLVDPRLHMIPTERQMSDLPEDPSSSITLHWSESTPDGSNDFYGDDDEDYFG